MTATPQYHITASIVAFESKPEELKQSALSFLNLDVPKLLLIIDHSPTDDLKTVCNFPDTLYFHHPENRGFGAGHNIAIRKTINHSPYHLVLNPDINFEPDVLPELLSFLEKNKDVAHLMPKIVDAQGNLQHLAKLLPTPADLIFKRFFPSSFYKKRKEKFQLLFTDYSKPMNVPYLSGCFMLLRTQALQDVGLFDERFFMYPEDIDLTRRLHAKYKTLYYPYVTVVHRHEASSYKSTKMLWVHLSNMIKYFNKWGWCFDSERKLMNRNTLTELNYFRSL